MHGAAESGWLDSILIAAMCKFVYVHDGFIIHTLFFVVVVVLFRSFGSFVCAVCTLCMCVCCARLVCKRWTWVFSVWLFHSTINNNKRHIVFQRLYTSSVLLLVVFFYIYFIFVLLSPMRLYRRASARARFHGSFAYQTTNRRWLANRHTHTDQFSLRDVNEFMLRCKQLDETNHVGIAPACALFRLRCIAAAAAAASMHTAARSRSKWIKLVMRTRWRSFEHEHFRSLHN